MFAIHLHQRKEKGCKHKVVTFDTDVGAFNFLDTLLEFADVQFQVFHIVDGNILHITDKYTR